MPLEPVKAPDEKSLLEDIVRGIAWFILHPRVLALVGIAVASYCHFQRTHLEHMLFPPAVAKVEAPK